MKFVMHLYLTMIALCYDAAYLSSKPCGLFQVRIQIVGQSCLVGLLFLLITWNLCGMNDCFIQVILITYNIQNKFYGLVFPFIKLYFKMWPRCYVNHGQLAYGWAPSNSYIGFLTSRYYNNKELKSVLLSFHIYFAGCQDSSCMCICNFMSLIWALVSVWLELISSAFSF